MSNECDMEDGEVSAAAAGGKNAALGVWQWDRRFPGGEADLVKVCQNMGEEGKHRGAPGLYQPIWFFVVVVGKDSFVMRVEGCFNVPY